MHMPKTAININSSFIFRQNDISYDVEHMIVLGRVMSGKGGDTILAVCKRIMAEEYPDLAVKMKVMLPDEKTRRVGQAVAAASLP